MEPTSSPRQLPIIIMSRKRKVDYIWAFSSYVTLNNHSRLVSNRAVRVFTYSWGSPTNPTAIGPEAIPLLEVLWSLYGNTCYEFLLLEF